jgi:broad specificity phosphatase PhoE
MPRLLLIRHCTPKLLKNDMFLGQTDVPLSDIGIKEAKRLKSRLAEEKFDICFSSSLLRAHETAKIIVAGHKVKIIPCDELRECSFGDIEGLTYQEIEQRYPQIAKEMADGILVNFPGGENFQQFNARVKLFTKRLDDIEPDATALIVAHGGPLRLLICNLLGIDISHWQQIRIDRASLSIIDTYSQTAILSLLNDTSHLK